MELTDKEFNAISTLIATFCCNQYKKAIGDKVVTESNIMIRNDIARVLDKLNIKINS